MTRVASPSAWYDITYRGSTENMRCGCKVAPTDTYDEYSIMEAIRTASKYSFF